MSGISAQIIKELREKTGAGMMDCKKALEENNGDFEQAVDWLRKKGLASAAKKAGRIAAEGLVGALVSGKKGVVAELNAETDFVARNDQFMQLTENITKQLLTSPTNDVEALKNAQLASGSTVQEEIQNAIAVIGENMNLRRIASVSVDNGIVVSYVHNAVKDGLGKIGVLVALETQAEPEQVTTIGKQIAMHIAAAKPESLTVEELDQNLVEREKNIAAEQSRASGKPESVVEKMIEGRIRKFYEEVVLLEQVFVIDGKSKINQVLADLSKNLGKEVKIKQFVRFALGEGIEKQEANFADEVAAAAGLKS
ncbi:MAG: elongation factor Ts [Sphingobacteriia bacterium]|nr:elongation factor Ts [Sphingobacteriia bacterium]